MNGCDTRRTERPRAGIERRARRRYVIEEQDTLSAHRRRIGASEGIGDIRVPRLAILPDLWRRISRAREPCWHHREGIAREMPRDQQRLIEAARPLSLPRERHWHDCVGNRQSGQGRARHLREDGRVATLPLVLERVDAFAHRPGELSSGDHAIQRIWISVALRADAGPGGAASARWAGGRLKIGNHRPACRTEENPARRTPRAPGRKDEIERPFPEVMHTALPAAILTTIGRC